MLHLISISIVRCLEQYWQIFSSFLIFWYRDLWNKLPNIRNSENFLMLHSAPCDNNYLFNNIKVKIFLLPGFMHAFSDWFLPRLVLLKRTYFVSGFIHRNDLRFFILVNIWLAPFIYWLIYKWQVKYGGPSLSRWYLYIKDNFELNLRVKIVCSLKMKLFLNRMWK